MMGSDMLDVVDMNAARRALLKHCTALAVALAAPGVLAQGAPTQRLTILVVGDSLSAEYGLKRGSGWVALLEQRLAQQKIAARVVNASISGDTTSGGRSRLPALLAQHKPDIVVIELGANDALRGLALKMTEENLTAMTQAAQKSGARVLLVGLQVPPNYGADYSTRFANLFAQVARPTVRRSCPSCSRASPTLPMPQRNSRGT